MNDKRAPEQLTKTYCAYCEKELHGREGKIYCNVDCKNNFNARILAKKRAQENTVFPKAIAQLKANYRILAGYNLYEQEPGKTIHIHIDELKKQGFDIRFCTGANSNNNREQQKYCFDYAYTESGSWITLSYDPDLNNRW